MTPTESDRAAAAVAASGYTIARAAIWVAEALRREDGPPVCRAGYDATTAESPPSPPMAPPDEPFSEQIIRLRLFDPAEVEWD